jgi:hypothetical protein
MSPDQFRNALIDLTEAVTALALYTHALNRIAETRRYSESKGPTPDGEGPLDILEKIARQLHCATNGLKNLYACRGIASGPQADELAVSKEHQEKPMVTRRRSRSGGDSPPSPRST